MFESFSVVFYQYWMVVKNLGIAPAGPLALVVIIVYQVITRSYIS